MIFDRDSITNPERTFLVLRNMSGEVIPKGGAVVWATAQGTNPGADVTKSGSASGNPPGTIGLFVGIAFTAILDQAQGLIQPYGYCEEALVLDDTVTAIEHGDILVPVFEQWYLSRSAAGDGKSGKVHAGEAVVVNPVPAAALHKVYIG